MLSNDVLIRYAFLLFAVLCSSSLHAQVDRAAPEGTVSDPSRRVVAGAQLRIVESDTGLAQEQPTNSVGYYRFPSVPVGRYTVTVANAGFKTRVIEGVTLQFGEAVSALLIPTGNFNNNNDNKASPNTGTGLPRELQFMVRVQF